jgi:hypothetical protein
MKYLFSLVVMLASTAAFAMPASTDVLIQGLVKTEGFHRFVDHQSGFENLSITRVQDKYSPEVQAQCGQLRSRSASVVKVTLVGHSNRQMYFQTSDRVEDLHPCLLQTLE